MLDAVPPVTVLPVTLLSVSNLSSDPTTINDVIDHFDHVARLVGVEHAGVGNDSELQPADSLSPDQRKQLQSQFKSYGFRDKLFIDGLNHPQRVFDLTEGLIRRKYSDVDIEKILGGNFKRALTQIWSAMTPPKDGAQGVGGASVVDGDHQRMG
jgi:membrane dipeptidase